MFSYPYFNVLISTTGMVHLHKVYCLHILCKMLRLVTKHTKQKMFQTIAAVSRKTKINE